MYHTDSGVENITILLSTTSKDFLIKKSAHWYENFSSF